MVSVGRSAAWCAAWFSAFIILLFLVVVATGPAVAQQTKVEFANQTGNAVDVVWLNNGQRQKLGTLQPSQSVTITTTVGHRFLLLSGGAVLSQHTVSGQPGERVVASARQQPSTSDGRSVRMVDMGGAAFVQTGPKQWVEVDKASGQVKFRFEETFRNQNEIKLFDRSRRLHLAFLFSSNKVLLAPDGQPLSPFADIKAVSDQSRVPGTDIAFDAPQQPDPQGAPEPSTPQIVNVEFVNNTGLQVQVAIVQDSGETVIGAIPAGEARPLTSKPGARYVFKQGGRALSRHTVSGQPGQRLMASAGQAPAAPQPKPSQFPGVSGQSVRMVAHARGAFVKTDPDRWVEVATGATKPQFVFNETRRANTWVELFDTRRDVRIYLALGEKKVLVQTDDKKPRNLYTITAASNESRIPGDKRQWDRIRTPISRTNWNPDRGPSFLKDANCGQLGNGLKQIWMKMTVKVDQTTDSGQDEVYFRIVDHSGKTIRVPSGDGYQKMNEDDPSMEVWTTQTKLAMNQAPRRIRIPVLGIETSGMPFTLMEDDAGANDDDYLLGSIIDPAATKPIELEGNGYSAEIQFVDNCIANVNDPSIEWFEKSPQVEDVVELIDQIEGRASRLRQTPLPGFKTQFDGLNEIWYKDHPQGIALTPSGRLAVNMSRTNKNASNYLIADCGVFMYTNSIFSNNDDELKWNYFEKFSDGLMNRCLLNRHPSSMQAVGEVVMFANNPVRFVYLKPGDLGVQVLTHLTLGIRPTPKGEAVGVTYYEKEDRFLAFWSEGAVTEDSRDDNGNLVSPLDITIYETPPDKSLLDDQTRFTSRGTVADVPVSGQGAYLIAEEDGDLFVVSTFSSDDLPSTAAYFGACSTEYLGVWAATGPFALYGLAAHGAYAAQSAARYPFTDIIIVTKIGEEDSNGNLQLLSKGEVVLRKEVGRTQWEQFCVLHRPAWRFGGGVAPISEKEMMALWAGRYIKVSTPLDDNSERPLLDDYEFSLQRLSN